MSTIPLIVVIQSSEESTISVMFNKLRYVTNGLTKGSQRRTMAGGSFKKNIYVEENSGLREKSYTTFEFDSTAITKLMIYLVIPTFVLLACIEDELTRNDKQVGRVRVYGVVPSIE
jgi:hypothetical protein